MRAPFAPHSPSFFCTIFLPSFLSFCLLSLSSARERGQRDCVDFVFAFVVPSSRHIHFSLFCASLLLVCVHLLIGIWSGHFYLLIYLNVLYSAGGPRTDSAFRPLLNQTASVKSKAPPCPATKTSKSDDTCDRVGQHLFFVAGLCSCHCRNESLHPIREFSGPSVTVGVSMYVLSISRLSEVEMVS